MDARRDAGPRWSAPLGPRRVRGPMSTDDQDGERQAAFPQASALPCSRCAGDFYVRGVARFRRSLGSARDQQLPVGNIESFEQLRESVIAQQRSCSRKGTHAHGQDSQKMMRLLLRPPLTCDPRGETGPSVPMRCLVGLGGAGGDPPWRAGHLGRTKPRCARSSARRR